MHRILRNIESDQDRDADPGVSEGAHVAVDESKLDVGVPFSISRMKHSISVCQTLIDST